MTLWMPLLDFVRSYQKVAADLVAQVTPSRCLQAQHLDRDQIAAFKYHSGFSLEPESARSSCPWLIADPELLNARNAKPDPARWQLHSALRRASGKGDEVLLYRRITPWLD